MSLINIFIYPTPSDMYNVEGLCGNFNGDFNDDLVHSDGSTSPTLFYWGFEPDKFSASWGYKYYYLIMYFPKKC